MERLQVLEVKFEAAGKVYLCGRRSSIFSCIFQMVERGRSVHAPVKELP